MGGRGTDVAREAASIVLLQDDFPSLVRSVRSGRRIYDNVRHAIAFLVAVHIPIAGMGLLPVLLGWPLLLFPLHVLFLEFVIDPACTFVFEAEEEAEDIMRRPPRSATARLFSAAVLRRSALLGLLVLAGAASVYAVALLVTSEEVARALSFATLVIANTLLIFVTRGDAGSVGRLARRPNAILSWIAAATLLMLGVALYVPAAANAFQFAAPPLLALVAIAGLATALVLGAAQLRRGTRKC